MYDGRVVEVLMQGELSADKVVTASLGIVKL
jgi:hypothetical protein